MTAVNKPIVVLPERGRGRRELAPEMANLHHFLALLSEAVTCQL